MSSSSQNIKYLPFDLSTPNCLLAPEIFFIGDIIYFILFCILGNVPSNNDLGGTGISQLFETIISISSKLISIWLFKELNNGKIIELSSLWYGTIILNLISLFIIISKVFINVLS